MEKVIQIPSTVAVRQMDEMTQHNAALVEQTNAAIEQTEAQASELDRIVAVFKTDAAAGFETTHPMQLIPMLRGHNSESDDVELETCLLDQPDADAVLVMNEPNLVDQAQIPPTDAVAHWLRDAQFQTEMRTEHSREIRRIGPAIT